MVKQKEIQKKKEIQKQKKMQENIRVGKMRDGWGSGVYRVNLYCTAHVRHCTILILQFALNCNLNIIIITNITINTIIIINVVINIIIIIIIIIAIINIIIIIIITITFVVWYLHHNPVGRVMMLGVLSIQSLPSGQ